MGAKDHLDIWSEVQNIRAATRSEQAKLLGELGEEIEFLTSELLESPLMGPAEQKALRRMQETGANMVSASLQGKVYRPFWAASQAQKLIEAGKELRKSKKVPIEYRQAEFKCIADYDKCKAKRGKHDVLCGVALFICIARRIIPFVR